MKKVLAIVGPTAVGKTDLSIELAKTFPAEIISGDSMQVYKGMDIGTGKIQKEEMAGIPHHMIDIIEIGQAFSVANFKEMVEAHIERITAANKLPMIVGGTGLYIQSVMYDFQFEDRKRDEALTEELEKLVHEQGVMPLYRQLQEIDPEQAKRIHPNNYRRVIRAIEIYRSSGLTMSQYHEQQTGQAAYDYLIIGLHMDRSLLYERIHQRIDQMIEDGLIEEVKRLYKPELENSQALKAIGYKEIIPYLKGHITLEEAITQLKKNSRNYAKRQLTWFRNKLDVEWYDLTSDREKVTEQIKESVRSFLAH